MLFIIHISVSPDNNSHVTNNLTYIYIYIYIYIRLTYQVDAEDTMSNIRELEHKYIEESEKMMRAEENNEFFDKSTLERIDQKLTNSKSVWSYHWCYCKTRVDLSSGTDTESNCSRNDYNKASRIKRMDIKANHNTKLPIRVKKIAKARWRLNLTSHEYN